MSSVALPGPLHPRCMFTVHATVSPAAACINNARRLTGSVAEIERPILPEPPVALAHGWRTGWRSIIGAGVRLFMTETSAVFRRYRSLGMHVFSLEHDLAQSTLSEPLSARQRDDNRALLSGCTHSRPPWSGSRAFTPRPGRGCLSISAAAGDPQRLAAAVRPACTRSAGHDCTRTPSRL